ncbi:uncharacterized protein LOC124371731, partial [Homalodisca vitripennis]
MDEDLADFLLLDRNLLLNSNTRQFWVHEFNEDHTQSEFYVTCLPLRDHADKFKKYYRMTVETYDYILSHIKGDLQKWSNFRTCIEPAEKLSILLRYLSTGMSFEALSETFRMSNYTVGKIVEEVCDCMWEQLAPVHLPVPNKQRFLEIAAEFKEKWNFPNC